MSSRRKSSTPCMIRVIPSLEQEAPEDMDVTEHSILKDPSSESLANHDQSSEPIVANHEQILEPEPIEDLGREVKGKEVEEVSEVKAAPQKRQPGGYECKYCSFYTQNLGDFKEHVDASHPNVILNPLYLCAVCNFSTKKFDSLTEHNETQHPGETNFKFKRVKSNSQTILEQTIEGKDNYVDGKTTNRPCDKGDDQSIGFSTNQLAATKINTHPMIDNLQPLHHLGNKTLENLIPKDQIRAVNINGTVIIPEPTVVHGLSHVTPLLQRPPNFSSIPKIAVPLNTTKYNSSLDSNPTLITSFNKFPYPTHAELSWLTAASKQPEDQIKVWFTTQRLKQGITWSPEEVEEARKKMFNGSIPPLHQTFTVLPNSTVSHPAKVTQPIIQTTSFEQSSLALTKLVNGFTVPRPTATMSSVTHHVQSLKRPLTSPAFVSEAKRLAEDLRERILMAPPPAPPSKDRLPMAPPPVPPEIKRSVALPLLSTDMKWSSSLMSSSLVHSKSRHPITSLVSPKNKLQPVPPTVFPDMKRPFPAPIIAPPFKNYAMSPASIASKEKHPITHALLAPDLKLPSSQPLLAPQLRRPTIIQSIKTPLKVPSQLPGCNPDSQKTKEHQSADLKTTQGLVKGCMLEDKVLTPLGEANGVSRGDGKWSQDQQQLQSHNGIIQLEPQIGPKQPGPQKAVQSQFPLLERMKGKTSEQLKILEENFQRNSFPTHVEADNLATQARLSREEIDSWFMERRALRDNLEQALLNSMGSKRLGSMEKQQRHHQQQQHGHLNGVNNHGGHLKNSPVPIIAPTTTTPTSCSVPLDSKSLRLLKDVFSQTRWPSPDQYTQLETQTGLGRTDIVRWFKDSRFALKTGALEWIDLFQKINGSDTQRLPPTVGPASLENIFSITREGKTPPKVEDIGRLPDHVGLETPQQDIKEWLTSKLRQSSSELKNGGQDGWAAVGRVGESFGVWLDTEESQMKESVGRRPLELGSDKDKKTEEVSGRVTG